MASKRVIIRRIQGCMRRLIKPSIIICPAKVPVMVELCPAAIKAMANNMGAHCEPSKGSNNL